MCGIVGYVGGRACLPVLLDGLRRLEYRGYDSAGVAVFQDGRLALARAEGKLDRLQAKLAGTELLIGTTGIGHTRWATHGVPSEDNAHPHLDCSGTLAVAHNGIIENYLSLKKGLLARGHRFRSETDTEVVPHLLEEEYDGSLETAVHRVAGRLRGSFALAVASVREPSVIVAARQGSPLVVGLGDGENYLASDIPAILSLTRNTFILDDGEVAVLTPSEVRIQDRGRRPVAKTVFTVPWDPQHAERGGYPHFMLKEIHEQPRALADTLAGRLGPGDTVNLDELPIDAEGARSLSRVFMTACGTACNASLVGKYLLERWARLPAEIDVASEFRYRDPVMRPGDLAILVSQSGETADTLEALREWRRRGARTLAVTNVMGSSISREADTVIYTRAGPEIAVASTKAYITQLLVLTLLALKLGELRGCLTKPELAGYRDGLASLPRLAGEVLEASAPLAAVAQSWEQWDDVFFIGRGLDYAVALEGQLKLKELSYIHAEAYPAGELKHGTLALIVPGIPVIALATQRGLQEKMASNIAEVKARGARVIGIVLAGDEEEEFARHLDELITIPRVDSLLTPILSVLPLQLLAYHAAAARGCDVDKPRNLAKSVTVE
ncbi:MAG TPA: glutamine--fructose-6-phosphate transaminase (isomerizing) [Clostridiales bacterium]|nr:glutamine--fructose-6-phosphate transaminase (isomerizing) [Clostridiales bacterium]